MGSDHFANVEQNSNVRQPDAPLASSDSPLSSDVTIDQHSSSSQIEEKSEAGKSEIVSKIDDELAHVWMVRTFLKHSDEAADDEELADVHRDLYDFMLALGPAYEAKDYDKYLKLANKKLSKLRRASEVFTDIQPEVSGHMNFKMAAKSLELAVAKITGLLSQA